LPDHAFIREAELLRSVDNPTGILPFSPHTLWRKVRAGSFPRPHKLAARVTAWHVKDVRRWVQSCTQAASNRSVISS
jgi:predicted DNA-binding transcriptional regulator AlpA